MKVIAIVAGLAVTMLIGFLWGDTFARRSKDNWLADAFAEYQRCGQSGRDCYYSPSQRAGVLPAPPELDVSKACVGNPMAYQGVMEQQYKRLIVRCSTGRFVGEYKIEAQLWRPDRLGHFMSTFGMADATAAPHIPLGGIVSPGESRR